MKPGILFVPKTLWSHRSEPQKTRGNSVPPWSAFMRKQAINPERDSCRKARMRFRHRPSMLQISRGYPIPLRAVWL